MAKVGVISLGCAKNQVDAEHMMHRLRAHGYTLVSDVSKADCVVINTCGFLESARSEAIENILEVAALKPEGTVKAIVVAGCMAQLLGEEIRREMPEADVVVGLAGANRIEEAVARALAGEQYCETAAPEALALGGARILGNAPYFAYLRVADGCDNRCAYCLIPTIRGRFRSRPMEEVVEEAETLAAAGVRELNVIAQDTTRYGEDLAGHSLLPALLTRLCRIEGVRWVRVLYAYPDRVTDELLDVMAREEKIVPYLDLPLQHADGDILRAMHRRGDEASLSALLAHIREKVPGIALRTTLIAGFPGETEAQFETLCRFVKTQRFERMGAFAYSREEGTPAAALPDQVPEEEKARRVEILMEEQSFIAEARNAEQVGRVLPVLVEGYDGFVKMHFGRSPYDAPEVDGKVFFTAGEQV